MERAIQGLTVAALYTLTMLVTPSAWAVKADRPEVARGDLMWRLEPLRDGEADASAQKRAVACIFQQASSGNLESYDGTLTVVEAGSGLKSNRMLSWVVWGSTS